MQHYNNVNIFILFSPFCLFGTIIFFKIKVLNKLIINKKMQLLILSQLNFLIKKLLILRLNFLLKFIKILWFINCFCVTISKEINNFTLLNDAITQKNNVITKQLNLKINKNYSENILFKILSNNQQKTNILFESDLINEFNGSTLKLNNLLILTTLTTTKKFKKFTLIKNDEKNLIKNERITRQLNIKKNFKTQTKKTIENLEDLYKNLKILKPCNRTIDTPLVRRLLSDSIIDLKRNLSIYLQIFKLNPSVIYPING